MKVIRDVSLWFLIQDSIYKKIILYTEKRYYNRLKKLFYDIDVEIAYTISDLDDNELQSVYDLLLEDPEEIMVVVAVDEFRIAKQKLEGLGLKVGTNFKNLTKYTPESLSMPYFYDPICGFNVYTGDKYNGFCIFGDINDSNAIRIITMGGSTTDAYIYSYPSWSQLLHKKLLDEGIANIVLCGGVNGYSSSEELFKIIRDCVPLNPDIIINYTGCNDLKLGDHPSINSYMKQISEFLLHHNLRIGTRFQSNPFGVTYGIDSYRDFGDRSNYEFWITNEKMIHAICEALSIKQITVHQPNLCNGKKTITGYEKAYLLNSCYCGVQRQLLEDNIKQSIEFKCRVGEDAKKFSWLYDISDIFDNEEDVYIDRLHVREKGNQIIANTIFNLLIEKNIFIQRKGAKNNAE